MVRKYLYGYNAIRSYLERADQAKIDGELLVGYNSKQSSLIDFATKKGIKCKRISQPTKNHRLRSQRLPQLLLHNSANDIVGSNDHTNVTSSNFLSSFFKQSSSTIVLLDTITDVHNIGAIIRSAAFFSVDVVISRVKLSSLTESTLAHVSAGSAFNIPLLFGCNLHRIIHQLKKNGYWIIGLEHKHTNQIADEVWHRKKIALVLGCEEKGISSLLLSQCDYLYRIAGSSAVDSLNVSVAAGIAFANRYIACQYLVDS